MYSPDLNLLSAGVSSVPPLTIMIAYRFVLVTPITDIGIPDDS